MILNINAINNRIKVILITFLHVFFLFLTSNYPPIIFLIIHLLLLFFASRHLTSFPPSIPI